MKFEEVIPVLRNGGAVCLDSLYGNLYLKINYECEYKSICFFRKENNDIAFKFDGSLTVLDEGWEIYKKPKKFLSVKECMETLLDGDKIFVEHKGVECFYEIGSDGYIYDNDGEKRVINLGSHMKFYI